MAPDGIKGIGAFKIAAHLGIGSLDAGVASHIDMIWVNVRRTRRLL